MRTVGQLYYQETGSCSAQVNIPLSFIRCTRHVNEANESNILMDKNFLYFVKITHIF